MNSKHRRILAAVFAEPTPANIDWNDLEALLVAAGCVIVEGRGSRARFVFDGEIESFYRPHPKKEALRYQVRAAREFLDRIGIRP